MSLAMVSGIVIGFTTSSSCPSNAILLRRAREARYSHLLLIGLGAVSGYVALFGVTLLWIVPFSGAIPQVTPFLETGGSLVFLYLGFILLHEAFARYSGRPRAHELHGDRNPDRDPPGGRSRGHELPGHSAPDYHPGSGGRPAFRPTGFSAGFAASGLNPINIVWWTALLSPGLSAGAGIDPVLPTGLLLGSTAWFAAYAWLLRRLGRRLSDRTHRILAVAVAAVLVGFGLHFLFGGLAGVFG